MKNEYLIDKLIDDELDEDQRRQLLSGLDAQPDGWRTCALAFLEAQAWRRGMKSSLELVGQVVAASRGNTSAASRFPAVVPGRKPDRFAVLYWPSLAAAILVSFATGVASQRFLPHNLANGGPHVGPSHAATESNLDLLNVANTEATNVRPAHSHTTVLPLALPDSVETPSGPEGEYASALREQMLGILERSGSHIRREHRVVPIHLRDGRRAILPVEDVYVTPVSGMTY
jgi:hypothetical protein